MSAADHDVLKPVDIPQLAPVPDTPTDNSGNSGSDSPQSVPRHSIGTSAEHQIVRKSQRSGRGISNKYSEFHTGDEYDKIIDGEVSYMQGFNPMYVERAGIGDFPSPALMGEIDGFNSHLMAMKLPKIYWDKSALWTDNGWIWFQH